MVDAEKKTVLVVGATGKLGGLIARALVDKPDVRVRCLVRAESRGKLGSLAGSVEIVEGDLGAGSEGALRAACDGAWSVVSAIQGGPDVIVDGQRRLLAAAAASGVRRLIPSSFSFDLFNLGEGDNVNADWRRAFAAIADRERGAVEVVHVLNGCFLDQKVLFQFMGLFDLAGLTASVWGDGDAPMDFTTFDDAARFTAEAAVDPGALPRKLNVAGDTLTFPELVRAYEEASGKKLAVRRLGSLADLDAEIERRKEGKNLYAYLPLMYYRAMLDGKGKLGELANGRYAHIHATTVRAYVRQEGL